MTIFENLRFALRAISSGSGIISTNAFRAGAVQYPFALSSPYGKPGDRLWVREAWQPVHSESDIFYQADESFKRFPDKSDWFEQDWHKHKEYPFRMRPSIFMPRWASRITIEITDVRVERLQTITRRECIQEGAVMDMRADGEKADFAALWDRINGKKHLWESNPWVWVIEFRAAKTQAVCSEGQTK